MREPNAITVRKLTSRNGLVRHPRTITRNLAAIEADTCDGSAMTATASACVACLLVGCSFAASSTSSSAVDAAPGSSDAALDAMPPTPTACDTMLAGYATGFENGLANWAHVILDNAQSQNPTW